MRHGEYRESVDIEFLVSDVTGYRDLRQRLAGPDGIAAIVLDHNAFSQTRDVRADQYGLCTTLAVDGHEIKFESKTTRRPGSEQDRYARLVKKANITID